MKALHKTKMTSLEKVRSLNLFLQMNDQITKLSQPTNDDSKPDKDYLLDLADTLTDQKSKKKIKKLIGSLW